MLQPKWSQALIVNPFTLAVLRISGADERTKVGMEWRYGEMESMEIWSRAILLRGALSQLNMISTIRRAPRTDGDTRARGLTSSVIHGTCRIL